MQHLLTVSQIKEMTKNDEKWVIAVNMKVWKIIGIIYQKRVSNLKE